MSDNSKKRFYQLCFAESKILLRDSIIKIILTSIFILIYLINLDTVFEFFYNIVKGNSILTMLSGGFIILILGCFLVFLGYMFTSLDYYYKEYKEYKNKLK